MACNIDYTHINQNSDFTIVERFYLKGEEQKADSFNWRIEYFTNGLTRFVAEHRNGEFINCIKNDDTSVLVIFNAPKFAPAPLNRTIYAELPNPLYPDGIENIEIPSRTNVVITERASTGAGRVESQVVFDYVQGEKGDKGDPGADGADGTDGIDGKTAYQSALDGGFVGTEAEFNESLASIGYINEVLDAINGEVI